MGACGCVAHVYEGLSGVSGEGGGCLCMGPPHLFSVGSPHRGMLAVSLGVEPRLYGLTVRCTAVMLEEKDSNYEGWLFLNTMCVQKRACGARFCTIVNHGV
jgi:hypothetical protein